MSDLISRSELIKHFETIQLQEDAIGIDFVAIIDEIKEQPTAYDIDKVIEELEKLADENYKAYCIAFNSDDRAEYDAYNNAIEIVKHGGVSDDVCEWKKSKDYPFDWLVGCDGCEVNHRQGDYCPRCGKKIKVVE